MLINSVTGPIDSSRLGKALMHEHICCADWSMRQNFGEKFFEYDKVVEIAASWLERVKALGVTTVVDGTPINLGRDVRLMRDASERSGVNILCSSGFYYQEEPWLEHRDEEQIYALLSGECREGISGTAIKPAIMKSGVSAAGLTPLMKKLLHATGRVAAEQGLPIFCHHDPSIKNGAEIIELYGSVGVKPHRIIMGHCGDSNDLDYFVSLLERGCYIGFDRLGYGDRVNSVENNMKNVAALCEKGYARQIFLSHDLAPYLAFWDSWEDTKSAATGGADFTLLFSFALPLLSELGVSDETVRQMVEENPRRFFEGEAPK